MNPDIKDIHVFYNFEFGQLIVTLGDYGLSVFERTTTPYQRGYEIMEEALRNASTFASCTTVEKIIPRDVDDSEANKNPETFPEAENAKHGKEP
jgi:hypothetical protein